jgi:hypothetical protein
MVSSSKILTSLLEALLAEEVTKSQELPSTLKNALLEMLKFTKLEATSLQIFEVKYLFRSMIISY